MLEPGVVRFGLGPLTEVVAQHHRFAELATHLDSSLVAVVAQERVLRGEDLRDDEQALEAVLGSGVEVPLVLQAFEPDYALPEYRADTRIDGGFLLPDDGWERVPRSEGDGPTPDARVDARIDARASATARVLHDAVEPWLSGSDGVVELVTVRGGADDAARALGAALERTQGDGALERRAIGAAQLLGLVAFAAASGGVHGRRRGAAAGRATAWWLARTATGLDRRPADDVQGTVGGVGQDTIDELEFRLEDLELVALRSAREGAWRLELAIADPGAEWAVAISAFDLTSDTATSTTSTTGAAEEGAHDGS
jgi:hypothetical protein